MVYHAIESIAVSRYFCPVAQYHCVGTASTKWALIWHFLFHHPPDLVVIPSEGTVPLPKCKRCSTQTKVGTLYQKHQSTQLCCGEWERRMQHETAEAEAARISLTRAFTAYGEDLERVEVFKYLGDSARLLAPSKQTYHYSTSQVASRIDIKRSKILPIILCSFPPSILLPVVWQ